MPTPNRGYPFPTDSDAATVPADLETPLNQIDADIQALVDGQEGALAGAKEYADDRADEAKAHADVLSAEVKAYAEAQTGNIGFGRNLWDPSRVSVGYVLRGGSAPDGSILPSTEYTTSGFIPVVAGQTYTLWGLHYAGSVRQGPQSWAFYDSAQRFVEHGIDSTTPVQTLTAPQHGFLRASFRHTSVAKPQVEAGDTDTTYEPFKVIIDSLDLSNIDENSIPAGVISPGKTTFARVGKNILDPALFEQGTFLNGAGTTPLAGYTTSGMSPVDGGKPYVGVVRMWSWYGETGTFISSVNTGSNTSTSVETAPANAAFVRASWSSSRDAIQQIEQGTTPTEFEPFGIVIPNLINGGSGGGGEVPAGPLSVSLTSSGALHVSEGPTGVSFASSLHGSRNGAFNLLGADFAGIAVSAADDDIAPLRTFNTVGANHGYYAITKLTVPGHGKTGADLGSVWSDGAGEWTLLLIDGDVLTLGPDYTVNGSGVVTAPDAAPVATLTHVSGATGTASIPVDQIVASPQLYPSIQRAIVTPLVDGKVIGEGDHQGVTAQVREVYEVLDYRSIIDTARSNVGTPFHEHRVAGAVRVENVYTFKPGLVLVDTVLTELVPTDLGSCGIVQAFKPAGTGGRIMPGVTGWTTPRSFANSWSSEIITTADLIHPDEPPTMSLDVMDWGGFALGYLPHAPGITSSAERIAHGGDRLWDLRGTQKSYPSPWAAKAAGWGRVEGHAYRAYLTPAQTAQIVAEAESAHAAHAALAAVTGL